MSSGFTSPDEIRFSSSRFRAGYDMDEVDDFLDRAYAALRGDGAMSAEEAEGARFTTRKFGDTYAVDEVDDYIQDHLLPMLRR